MSYKWHICRESIHTYIFITLQSDIINPVDCVFLSQNDNPLPTTQHQIEPAKESIFSSDVLGKWAE